VDDQVVGSIESGLMVLLAVGPADNTETAEWMARKLVNMRIFSDADGKFNHSLTEVKGEMLVVSQFTLYGDVTKGNRPSFIQAADPQIAEQLYEHVCESIEKLGIRVATGRFGAMMKVSLQNDGPVTIIVER
jgi:D-tyrosyl-tRNA(Tyr) deacylase